MLLAEIHKISVWAGSLLSSDDEDEEEVGGRAESLGEEAAVDENEQVMAREFADSVANSAKVCANSVLPSSTT